METVRTYYLDRNTRLLPLSNGLCAIVDADLFRTLLKRKWYASQSGKRLYVRAGLPGAGKKYVYLHRFVIGGNPETVDHINGNGLDCRRGNLRPATNAENIRSQRPKPGRLKGVTRVHGRWLAQIMFDYKNHSLGMFDTPEEAGRAYDAKARELFGEFAHLNFSE